MKGKTGTTNPTNPTNPTNALLPRVLKERRPGSPCLRTRMLAAKEATKSQFGTASAEYAQVKGIKV